MARTLSARWGCGWWHRFIFRHLIPLWWWIFSSLPAEERQCTTITGKQLSDGVTGAPTGASRFLFFFSEIKQFHSSSWSSSIFWSLTAVKSSEITHNTISAITARCHCDEWCVVDNTLHQCNSQHSQHLSSRHQNTLTYGLTGPKMLKKIGRIWDAMQLVLGVSDPGWPTVCTLSLWAKCIWEGERDCVFDEDSAARTYTIHLKLCCLRSHWLCCLAMALSRLPSLLWKQDWSDVN